MTEPAGHRIVVALGGNAITRPDDAPDIPHQFAQTSQTAQFLVDLIEAGHRVVVTHGNGPQVGMVLRRVELSMPQVYPLPLELCVADTQGGMGYMIAQCMNNELLNRGHRRTVTAVVTSVVVDREDPAFSNPTKPIGGFMTAAAARSFENNPDWVIREVAPGKYRRVVPSPRPTAIVESEAIARLVQLGQVIIACGGGGIPVVQDPDGSYRGVAAVVDKDLASALLAIDIQADYLLILTAVDQVCLNYGKPDQQAVDHLTIEEARALLDQGQFPPGSMGPKIEAAIQFVEQSAAGNPQCVITSPQHVASSLAGLSGTRLVRS